MATAFHKLEGDSFNSAQRASPQNKTFNRVWVMHFPSAFHYVSFLNSLFTARLDLEAMKDIRAQLGNIQGALTTLHENTQERDIGKYI